MIRDNLNEVRRRLEAVCAKIDKSPGLITIVGVAKNRPLEQIRELVKSGIADLGENKVQEAVVKHNQLQFSCNVQWHMVGHLQTNKVKEAVKIFDLIHSVDSLRLAAEIDKQAGRVNKIQDILIEVKTSPEPDKFGVEPDELIGMVKTIARFKNIDFKGLMTIAPAVDSSEKTRPYFRQLREIRDKINLSRITAYPLDILSMGMTDDFETAVEEGANMLRLGRILFNG